MKRLLFVLPLVLVTQCKNEGYAGDKHHQVVVNSFAVPYAVPVAVPVAAYAPYSYSTSAAQQQTYAAPPRSAEDILAEHLAAKIADRLGMTLQPLKAAAPISHFVATCAKCHAQGNPDLGKPQLVEGQLNEVQRLKAILALAKGEMPKGKKITDAERGDLITELSTIPEEKAAAPLPPQTEEAPPPPPQQ